MASDTTTERRDRWRSQIRQMLRRAPPAVLDDLIDRLLPDLILRDPNELKRLAAYDDIAVSASTDDRSDWETVLKLAGTHKGV